MNSVNTDPSLRRSFFIRTLTRFLSVLVIVSVAGAPLMSQAWFFNAALAQSDAASSSTSTITADSVQNMPVMVSNVSMASDDQTPVDPESDIPIADSEAIVPDMGSSGTLADMIDVPTTDTISTYVVQPGDSVKAVAARFGVSENTVRWANDMGKNDVLHVGENLVILPITGVKHVVVAGDTIASIAAKYKADPTDIAEYNNLDVTDALTVGDTIIVPDGEVTITQVVTDKKTGKKTSVPITGTGLIGGISTPHGYYIRPITLGPGIEETQGFHTRYNAVDIGAPKNTPIHAMADGTVIVAKGPECPAEAPIGWNGGYGNMTIIQHGNGSQTLYAHQTCLDVTVGQKVKQGQVIGGVGNTGLVHGITGLHLHFEIRGVYPTPVLY